MNLTQKKRGKKSREGKTFPQISRNSFIKFHNHNIQPRSPFIHWFVCCTGAGGCAPNISANGFPNCKRSSMAFVGCVWIAVGSAPPKRSTPPAGDDRNGLLTIVGEPTFDCCYWVGKREKANNWKLRNFRSIHDDRIQTSNLELVHGCLLLCQKLSFQVLIDAIGVRVKFGRRCCSTKRWASRREGINTALYVFLTAYSLLVFCFWVIEFLIRTRDVMF